MLARLHSGRVQEARDRNRFLLDEAADRNDLHIRIFLEGSITPFVALAADDVDEAERALAWYGAHVDQTGRHLHLVYSLFNRVLLDLRRGDAETATKRFDDPAHVGSRNFVSRLQLERQFDTWLRGTAEIAAGRNDLAAQRVAAIEKEQVSWALPLARLLRAQLEPAARTTHLDHARRAFDAHGMPLFASVCGLGLGVAAPDLSPKFAALFAPGLPPPK
jgi:hypothetical protein